MGEIVNLRRERKARDRLERQRQAAVNRERFGRTKSEREQDTLERERQARDLDGKEIE